MKVSEFDAVVAKLGFETKQTHHLLAWFTHEGRLITRTKRSNTKGDAPAEFSIRKQMKLSKDQLADAVRCTFGKTDYVAHLRDKGLI